MIATLRSEWIKMRSVRLLWGLTAGALALTVLQVWGISVALHRARQGFGHFTVTSERFPLAAANVFLFVVALGVITMAGETRHHTADHTFVCSPRRSRVVVAKAAVVFAASMLIGAVSEAVRLAIGIPWLRAEGLRITLDGPALFNVAAVVVMVGIMGVLGVAIGAVVRHQIGALVGALAWLLIAEGIIRAISASVGRFLIVGVLDAMAGVRGPHVLARWEGFALLVGYVIILCGVGAVMVRRADFT